MISFAFIFTSEVDMPSLRSAKKKPSGQNLSFPPIHNWSTTDDDEINRRRWRAQNEVFQIRNQNGEHLIFSNFTVQSKSGLVYSVEIRDLKGRRFHCTCVDFRTNGLGTCKHVEAVLALLEARHKRLFRQASHSDSPRIDLAPDYQQGRIVVERNGDKFPHRLRAHLTQSQNASIEDVELWLAILAQEDIPGLRISQEVSPWLEVQHRKEEQQHLLREYERRVQAGEWPAYETLVPLFPYQREGMLHLAFNERALLADEMGLGKTIQAIAACALLQRMGKARQTLVVTPASLKTEWEEQIQRFTNLELQIIYGQRHKRFQQYAQAPFFTIVNYEQMISDAAEVNARLKPDIIILDEAQRIKNWSTKTAQAIKRLKSRYAFVLTGTPIENRIDELHSIMGFLDPAALGPLFRFNRDFYELDERGRPAGYKNLGKLHERIRPYLLRRRKAEVETELPDRSDRTYFVPMSPTQRRAYGDHEAEVARLVQIAKRRPLTEAQQEKLMRELAMMRMLCDTTYILNPADRSCPKLAELERILEECCAETDTKVILFSEWERMLELVRGLCDRMKLGYAVHTGSVPQKKRRAEIRCFKEDPLCRVFLSTDSGSTGLNLQNASVVINCDLPWNPAKLEQRIARAWRKNQLKPVTVIHLVSQETIEHKMLSTLAQKQALADGVLDLRGDLETIQIRTGRQAMLKRLEQIMAIPPIAPVPPVPMLPSDRPRAFAEKVKALVGSQLVRCEEQFPKEGDHSLLLVVVERDSQLWRSRLESDFQQLLVQGQDPLAPARLEVLDRATAEALERLSQAGLIVSTVRASRGLFPESASGTAGLSPEEKTRADGFRQQAARKLKMARLLHQGEMEEEALTALNGALLELGRALAVENRQSAPEKSEDFHHPSAVACWKERTASLNTFLTAPTWDGGEKLLTQIL
jgi:superfamily II DNA or RNA helicase